MAFFGSDGLGEFIDEVEQFKSEIEEAKQGLSLALHAAVRDTASDLETEMKENLLQMTEPETGQLLDSIQFEPVSDTGYTVSYSVFTGADHAPYIEYGTVPHEIMPRGLTKEEMRSATYAEAQDLPALRFQSSDGTTTVVIARHPGTDPRPFFRKAVNTAEAEEWLPRELDDKTNELFEAVFR